MAGTDQDQEAKRTVRNYILLAAAALFLIVPLLGVAYLYMTDKSGGGTPGSNLMNVFEKRESGSAVRPGATPVATPAEQQPSLAAPSAPAAPPEAGGSLGFVKGGQELQQVADKQDPAVLQSSKEVAAGAGQEASDSQAAAPQNGPAQASAQQAAPAPQGKAAWSAPRLGTAPQMLGSHQSQLRPAQWASEKSTGRSQNVTPTAARGAGASAGPVPGGKPGGMPAGAMPPGGMPAGMDPAMLQKMMGSPGAGGAPGGSAMPGGMDPAALQKMIGGSKPPAGGGAPQGMDPAMVQKLMGNMGGSGETAPPPPPTKSQ